MLKGLRMNVNYKMVDIHPLAKIGDGVEIGSFTSIARDVVIGEGTWIGPNVTIMDGARIGKNCKIFPGSVISAIPQDLKFEGEVTTVEIGDNAIIRECCTINRGTNANLKTIVGDNCLIMAYVHVAHDCILGRNVILANSVNMAGHVEIDDYAIISGMTAIHQFVKIGAHVMISGGSLVRKDVPPYVKAAREPLSYVGVNTIGLSRRGFSRKDINEIQKIYRILFIRGKNTTQAITDIHTQCDDTIHRAKILSFIKKANRGIMKGYQM